MKKKLFVLIIVIITIINLSLGYLIFFNVQILEAPEITINIELSDIDPEKTLLKTNIDVKNTNNFEINLENIRLKTTTDEGYEVANVLIKGGGIKSNKNVSFVKDIPLSFNGHSPELLITKLSGEIGANFLFIKKTIPFKINVVTNIEKIINELSAPVFEIIVDFDEIINNGININSTINVYNPNPFDIFLENISTNILTEKMEKIGNLKVICDSIPARSKITLNSTGFVMFKALDAKKLTINLNGNAGVKIAGYRKDISYNIESIVNIPNLDRLILNEKNPTFISLKIDEKLTLGGIQFYVILEINNTYKFDIEVRNLVFKIFTVKDDKNSLIGSDDNIENIIAESGKKGATTCNVLIPYYKILPIDWKTDWVMGSATGRVGIKGVNQSALVEIRGYQSLHPLR